jgi:AraC family L-rhamnose operon regulatory protein RhaS
MNKLTVEYYFPTVTTKLARYSSDPEDNGCEHCHEFDELVIVEEGHGLHVINGKPMYIQQGDVFFVRGPDFHFYDELGTLKLINILINPMVNFHYLTDITPLLLSLSGQEAARYGWLAPDTRAQCKLIIEKIFASAMQSEDKCALRESCFFNCSLPFCMRNRRRNTATPNISCISFYITFRKTVFRNMTGRYCPSSFT